MYVAYNDKVQNGPLNSLNSQRGKSDLDYIALDPIIITVILKINTRVYYCKFIEINFLFL